MKARCGLILLLLACLGAGCSTTFHVARAVQPETGLDTHAQRADSLTPLLRWKPTQAGTDTYDIVLRKGVLVGWALRLMPAEEVYYVEGIKGTEHRVQAQLEPKTHYYWAVRVRNGDAVGPWSGYDMRRLFGSASNLQFVFITPDG